MILDKREFSSYSQEFVLISTVYGYEGKATERAYLLHVGFLPAGFRKIRIANSLNSQYVFNFEHAIFRLGICISDISRYVSLAYISEVRVTHATPEMEIFWVSPLPGMLGAT